MNLVIASARFTVWYFSYPQTLAVEGVRAI